MRASRPGCCSAPTLGAGEECSAIWSANVIATSLEGDLLVLVEQLEAYPASRAQQSDELRVAFCGCLIANLNTPNFRRQQIRQASEPVAGGVTTTLSRAPQPGDAIEMNVVGQVQAKNSFLVNLAVFRTQDKVMGTLLNISG